MAMAVEAIWTTFSRRPGYLPPPCRMHLPREANRDGLDRVTNRISLSRLRRGAMLLLALILLAAAWELYKLVIPETGVRLGDALILPRSDDASMPHLTEIADVFGQQEVAGVAGGGTVLSSVLSALWYSLRLATAGFAVGVVVGFLLALAMQRLRIVERALLPYVVLSQTVPLIALAPLVYGWSGNLSLFGLDWKPWMSVSVIAAYLAFFPVAIGALRGLASPPPVQTELLACYAASWWQTLLRLRLPASVPYLIPALKLAAAAAVVGAIVAEISIGLRGGIGRLIISYAQQATGDPARVYAPILGAAVMGLVAVGLVSVLDVALRRYHPQEETP
jgi:NitT/TauT family transport system permease protein